MLEALAFVSVILLAVVLFCVLALLKRRGPDLTDFGSKLDTALAMQDRVERSMKDEIGRNRAEASDQSRGLREELQNAFKAANDTLVGTVERASRIQKERLEDFAGELKNLKQASENHAAQLRTELAAALGQSKESIQKQLTDAATLQKQQLDSFAKSLERLTESNEKKANELRALVEAKLLALQQDNALKLEEMRKTVDEKLQGALEKRLGESFKLVSERLEAVHKGLGEMQNLATGVGDLKKVLTNVKTRGTWGEIQLGNLLEQILSPEQYDRNVAPTGTRATVEFAIKLPGRTNGDAPVWLPIDAKFPKEDYERLVDASERGDVAAVEQAGKDLELRVRAQGKDIREKYIKSPHTTDFALLYLPTEGLYAEVVRRPALVDSLQRDCRVVVVGPTTLAALLNSLQLGFQTLKIQQRSSEVWKVLENVKTEFGKFGDVLDKVKKKLEEAGNVIDEAKTRKNVVEKRLKDVDALPIPAPREAPALPFSLADK